MAQIVWDQVGQRYFETGVDRGVLYLPDGSGVVWNGLTGVEEDLADEISSPIFIDGVKYYDYQSIPDYKATLRAFTYPDEFQQFEGIQSIGTGLFAGEQPIQTFGLSYRTRVGNDLDGVDHGYRIHLVYNLVAVPSTHSYATIDATEAASEFSWTISGVPEELEGYRPTAHVILDTRYLPPYLVESIEGTLYGDSNSDPYLPPLSELAPMILDWALITITDNGNGTWTAEGPDDLITMLESTIFQITEATATYLDADTYTIETG